MRWILGTIGSVAFAFGAVACTANTQTGEEVGTDQAATVYNDGNCANECTPNATIEVGITGQGESGIYTRSAATIDGCNGTDRTSTWVDLDVSGEELGYIVHAEAGTQQSDVWAGVTTKAQCDASLFELNVLEFGGDGHPNSCNYTSLFFTSHAPIWSNGKCIGPTLESPQGVVMNGSYQVHARATRFDGDNRSVTVGVAPAQ